jgi:hypothetical protein
MVKMGTQRPEITAFRPVRIMSHILGQVADRIVPMCLVF